MMRSQGCLRLARPLGEVWEPLLEVISACLRLDPAARPTAAALGAFPAVAAARAAAEQLARAAAHRLTLSETRLATGNPCTAEELVCCLQARAGCGDPSARAVVGAAADSGTSPARLAVAGASAPAPTALVAAPVVAGVDASDSRSIALPSTPASTSGLPAAAPLPSETDVSAANAALREALGDAKGDAVVPALHRFAAEALPAAVAAVGEMHLWGRGLKDAHAEALTAALPRFSGLRVLDLGCNNIGSAGAGALAATLPHLTQLNLLGLGNTSIGDAGAAALAVALPHLTQLQYLTLHANSIGDAGASALAATLPYLTQLHLLDLGNTSIGDAGASALAVALPHLTQLRLRRYPCAPTASATQGRQPWQWLCRTSRSCKRCTCP